MGREFECITIEKDESTSAILGHAGFIKTVEDLYEAMLCSVPGVKFGVAFAEASGPCLVRSEGNDEGLRAQAERNILKIAAGHTFLILFREAYPINVINNVTNVSEVGYDLLRHQQPRASYRGKGRDQPLGHRYCRWSLIACNRKQRRQAK